VAGISKSTLDNGITVVLEEMPFVRSIAFGAFIKNGSRNENKNVNGISHFIEHMLFKGTEKRTAKMIAEEMDAIGGQLNAYTTKEFTCYYARTLDNHFDTALDIISDMLINSKFDEDDIAKERGVIIEEINMYEDSPEDLVHDLLEQSVFKGAALGLPVIGDKKRVALFNRNTFIDYYSSHYHQDNIVIAAAGNFKSAAIIEKMNNSLRDFKRETAFIKPAYKTHFKQTHAFKEKDIEQVHICMGFPGIKINTDDTYAVSILNAVFGGGMSSRLFQTIREERGLVYSIYSHNASYLNCGIFSVYAALAKEQANTVIDLIKKEISSLKTDPITPDLLSKSKEQIKSSYLLSLEASANIMSGLGRQQLLRGRALTPGQTIKKIDAVTMDSVYRVADHIFDMDKLSLCAVGDVAGLENIGMQEK